MILCSCCLFHQAPGSFYPLVFDQLMMVSVRCHRLCCALVNQYLSGHVSLWSPVTAVACSDSELSSICEMSSVLWKLSLLLSNLIIYKRVISVTLMFVLLLLSFLLAAPLALCAGVGIAGFRPQECFYCATLGFFEKSRIFVVQLSVCQVVSGLPSLLLWTL